MVDKNSSERAGRYVLQDAGYKAFIPASLPPEDLKLNGTLQDLLSQADQSLGRLDGSVYTLPDADLFVMMYVKKEAVLSSQIEGTQSSLHDLLKAEAQLFDDSAPKDVDEVINYVSAMNYGIDRLVKLPVSIRLIKEIHKKLLYDVRGGRLEPGELRRSQNWIGPAGCTLSTASFIPPPYEELPEILSDLEKFFNINENIPSLVKIALTHAQFETIHPFLDGNGRVGRLLITFLLTEKKILHKPVLYISHYFKKNRQEYYDRLQAVRKKGAWEEWLEFFLKGIISVSEEALTTARNILILRERHRDAIINTPGISTGSGLKVLEYLFQKPILTVNRVAEITGKSYAAANSIVTALVKLGILVEYTGRLRNRRFSYSPYLKLFSD